MVRDGWCSHVDDRRVEDVLAVEASAAVVRLTVELADGREPFADVRERLKRGGRVPVSFRKNGAELFQASMDPARFVDMTVAGLADPPSATATFIFAMPLRCTPDEPGKAA